MLQLALSLDNLAIGAVAGVRLDLNLVRMMMTMTITSSSRENPRIRRGLVAWNAARTRHQGQR